MACPYEDRYSGRSTLRPYMGKHIGMPRHYYLTTADAMYCVPTRID